MLPSASTATPLVLSFAVLPTWYMPGVMYASVPAHVALSPAAFVAVTATFAGAWGGAVQVVTLAVGVHGIPSMATVAPSISPASATVIAPPSSAMSHVGATLVID